MSLAMAFSGDKWASYAWLALASGYHHRAIWCVSFFPLGERKNASLMGNGPIAQAGRLTCLSDRKPRACADDGLRVEVQNCFVFLGLFLWPEERINWSDCTLILGAFS